MPTATLLAFGDQRAGEPLIETAPPNAARVGVGEACDVAVGDRPNRRCGRTEMRSCHA
jgi:hypothetical protein